METMTNVSMQCIPIARVAERNVESYGAFEGISCHSIMRPYDL